MIYKLLFPTRLSAETLTSAHSQGLDLFLDPKTSKRDNFRILFKMALLAAKKERGNFLEIGGGSGKFFNHNMEKFGHMIDNYIIIEPYKLLSGDGQPLAVFMEQIEKWQKKSSAANITVVHDFSTNPKVIELFADSFFDFVYIDGDHSYIGAKSDLMNYYPKVRRGGVIAGHDYCCNKAEYSKIDHAPWCGKYIYPLSTSNQLKHGKEKTAFCGIFKGAEEFAKEKNFYWLYTLEGRGEGNAAGENNPSYFTIKF